VTCGTYGGFQRHYRRKEPPCDACVKAKRRYDRERFARLAVCGTEKGYRRHLRAKEPACPACYDAHISTDRPAAARHGTESGYIRHLRLYERPCPKCAEAARAGRRARMSKPTPPSGRRSPRRPAQPRRVTALIEDAEWIIENGGGWRRLLQSARNAGRPIEKVRAARVIGHASRADINHRLDTNDALREV
jgi:hypothetical protein